ncbi:inovirus-type Gp2 protein [Chromatium okenii]|uniref:YagK/YfjJ domain-containing protein n=1 Tax=Chromatium okenii TaxID=61644 RepID=UPI0026EE3C78|nr:inovirus-type Gp2 protein [Chromatium okenii]
MKQHRKDFFRLRRSHWLFDHMVGFCWKLEYGKIKGYHYHMLFFYDGASVSKDITRTQQLGAWWEEEITKGIGVYYSSNLQAHEKYENHINNAVGMVSHDDPQKIQALAIVVNYMTKIDECVSLTIAGKDRTFGRSTLPKEKTETRGRPRANPTLTVNCDKINPYNHAFITNKRTRTAT